MMLSRVVRADAAIDELHAPLGVDQDQPVAGARGHHLQQFLRRAQRLLRARLLADVDGHADDAQHLAGRVAHQAGRIEQRDVVAVLVADAVLQAPPCDSVSAVEPLLQQVAGRPGARAQPSRLARRQFAGGVAEHALAAFAGRNPGLGVDFVDDAAQLARDRAEALIAGGKRGLAELARGDVHHQAEHAPGGAVGRALHHEGAVQRPVPAAVGVPEAILGLEHVRVRIHASQAVAEIVELPGRDRCRSAAASS